MSNNVHSYFGASQRPRKNLHRLDGPALTIFEFGEEWWVHGERHTMGEIPTDGSFLRKEWFVNGKKHRLDGPAYESEETTEWFLNGQYHRVDGPAVIGPGYERWHQFGDLHRVDGPAATIDLVDYVQTEWYQHGIVHRLDGPAIVDKFATQWFLFGDESNELTVSNFVREAQAQLGTTKLATVPFHVLRELYLASK